MDRPTTLRITQPNPSEHWCEFHKPGIKLLAAAYVGFHRNKTNIFKFSATWSNKLLCFENFNKINKK